MSEPTVDGAVQGGEGESVEREAATAAEGLPAWFGAFRAGRSDAARRTEEILRGGYGREG